MIALLRLRELQSVMYIINRQQARMLGTADRLLRRPQHLQPGVAGMETDVKNGMAPRPGMGGFSSQYQ